MKARIACMLPDIEYLRSIIDYDPCTGVLTWRARPRELFTTSRSYKIWNARFCGRQAGYSSNGYIQVRIGKSIHLAHRVAWAYMTGAWPEKQLDHIDGDKSNNMFANLREATNSENGYNRERYSNNTSGVKGVCWDKSVSKWKAQIKAENACVYSKYFDDIDSASKAIVEERRKFHGQFARS